MSLRLLPIPLDRLEESRNLWLPFVASIAKRQRCYVEQRLADIYSGNVALILVWDGEKATGLIGWSAVIRGPVRIAKLVWVTGNLSALRALYEPLELQFRSLGFAGMSAMARPGWHKDMKRWGYRMTHVEYEKDF